MLLVAGRDLQLSGNVSAGSFDHQGAIVAHGQIKMTGTPGIEGTVISNDACPGASNLIAPTKGIEDELSVSSLTGNVKITYNTPLTLPFGAEVSVVNWIEL